MGKDKEVLVTVLDKFTLSGTISTGGTTGRLKDKVRLLRIDRESALMFRLMFSYTGFLCNYEYILFRIDTEI